MAQRRPFKHQARRNSGGPAGARAPIEPPKPLPRSVPKQYGPPFVLMEDDKKQTFSYQSGNWVAYERSIAECRTDCQVKLLAQKVNNMSRYEIRPELPVNA
jgi:hypothetical protein